MAAASPLAAAAIPAAVVTGGIVGATPGQLKHPILLRCAGESGGSGRRHRCGDRLDLKGGVGGSGKRGEGKRGQCEA